MLWVLQLKFPYCCDTRGENSWLTAVMNEKLIITTYVNIMVFPYWHYSYRYRSSMKNGKTLLLILFSTVLSAVYSGAAPHSTLLVTRMRTQSNLNFFLCIPTSFFAEFQNRIERIDLDVIYIIKTLLIGQILKVIVNNCASLEYKVGIVIAMKNLHSMYQLVNLKRNSNFTGKYQTLFHPSFPNLDKYHCTVYLCSHINLQLVKDVLVSPMLEKFRKVSQQYRWFKITLAWILFSLLFCLIMFIQTLC